MHETLITNLKQLDGWRRCINHHQITQALNNLADHISYNYSDKNLVLICILTGAVYFTVDLSRKLNIDHSVNFIRVSSGFAKQNH